MHIPKSYRYYKLADLAAIYQIEELQIENLLAPFEEVTSSDLLKATLKRNLQMPMKNEKAKSELIVMPVLVEMWDINQRFKPLSGFSFNVESQKGLKRYLRFFDKFQA
jgi:hypothetical protein